MISSTPSAGGFARQACPSKRMTTHYSAPELSNLIEAAEKRVLLPQESRSGCAKTKKRLATEPPTA